MKYKKVVAPSAKALDPGKTRVEHVAGLAPARSNGWATYPGVSGDEL